MSAGERTTSSNRDRLTACRRPEGRFRIPLGHMADSLIGLPEAEHNPNTHCGGCQDELSDEPEKKQGPEGDPGAVNQRATCYEEGCVRWWL